MTLSARLIRRLLAFGIAAFLVATSARAQGPAATAPAPAAAPASTPGGAPEGWRGIYVGGGGAYSNVSALVDEGYCYDDCYWCDHYDYDEGDAEVGYAGY